MLEIIFFLLKQRQMKIFIITTSVFNNQSSLKRIFLSFLLKYKLLFIYSIVHVLIQQHDGNTLILKVQLYLMEVSFLFLVFQIFEYIMNYNYSFFLKNKVTLGNHKRESLKTRDSF